MAYEIFVQFVDDLIDHNLLIKQDFHRLENNFDVVDRMKYYNYNFLDEDLLMFVVHYEIF